MIFTGITALFDQGIITYNSKKKYIELENGANSQNYNSNIYHVYTQSPQTINIGIIIINDNKYYCPERLFIELEKFPLENTIKAQAIKKLESIINPQLVNDIFNKIKNKRRKINKERIISFLNKNLYQIDGYFFDKKIDSYSLVREYIMAIISKTKTPCSLIKGGSAVELYVDFKRSTNDIDVHIAKSKWNQIIKILTDRSNLIYFEILNLDEINTTNKTIFKLFLKAKTNKRKLKPIIDNLMNFEISLNATYNELEIEDIIRQYQITKTNLKIISNASCFIFTKEMLLAEKYQSLISKNKNCTRTKDLIDLVNLWNDQINFLKFQKWLFRKWENNSKDKKDEKQVIEFIIQNKDIELTKIKQNFIDAIKMYDTNVDYENAINIYKKISNLLIDKDK